MQIEQERALAAGVRYPAQNQQRGETERERQTKQKETKEVKRQIVLRKNFQFLVTIM